MCPPLCQTGVSQSRHHWHFGNWHLDTSSLWQDALCVGGCLGTQLAFIHWILRLIQPPTVNIKNVNYKMSRGARAWLKTPTGFPLLHPLILTSPSISWSPSLGIWRISSRCCSQQTTFLYGVNFTVKGLHYIAHPWNGLISKSSKEYNSKVLTHELRSSRTRSTCVPKFDFMNAHCFRILMPHKIANASSAPPPKKCILANRQIWLYLKTWE